METTSTELYRRGELSSEQFENLTRLRLQLESEARDGEYPDVLDVQDRLEGAGLSHALAEDLLRCVPRGAWKATSSTGGSTTLQGSGEGSTQHSMYSVDVDNMPLEDSRGRSCGARHARALKGGGKGGSSERMFPSSPVVHVQPGTSLRSGSGSFRNVSQNDQNMYISSHHDTLHLQSIPEDRVHRRARRVSQRKLLRFPSFCRARGADALTLHSLSLIHI